eukprot:c6739_g1_i1.p1 GENE.c6739_g1_i1~~c6739_g1_i1.p1  ORF type:complete len:416 (-),score=94.15 c6739_g1_i1:8-1255(-)
MGKKQKGGKRRGEDELSDTDTASLSLRSSGLGEEVELSEGEQQENVIIHSLSDHLEHLTESRKTIRESALQEIIKGLQHFRQDWVDSNKQTLSFNLRKCTSKGGKECNLALEAFGLVCVTLGETNAEMLSEWEAVLTKIALHSSDADNRSNAIILFSLICFVMDEEGHVSKRCMAICDEIFNSITATETVVTISAMHAWAFLLTSCSVSDVLNMYYESGVISFSQLLQSGDVDVRMAAGENLALLSDYISKLDENIRPLQVYLMVDTLPEQIEALMEECSKRFSKKDKKRMRTTFRSISRTLDDGESPSESLKINGKAVEIVTWAQICRLEIFRHVLGTGFQPHFQENEVLHAIFDYHANAEAKLSTAEKSQKRSVQEKSRATARANHRQVKETNQRGGHDEDDDDDEGEDYKSF